ncbi:MAG: sugar transferase [Pseudomonadota bacterium]|nr:sugar transferase [Pseudomonadota bacterium]
MVQGHAIDSSLQPASLSRKSFLIHSTTVLLGLFVCASLITLGTIVFTPLNLEAPQYLNVLIGALIGYLISSITLHNLGRFPGNRPLSYMIPVLTVSLLSITAVIIFTRIDYSRSVLLLTLCVVPVVTYSEFKLRQHLQTGRYAVVPFGFYHELLHINPTKFYALEEPSLTAPDTIGIIVDSNEQLSAEWQQFIASELSKDTPVMDSVAAYESISGKSPLHHYGELAGHELLPSQAYLTAKRLLESSLILLSSPITLPFIFIVAIAVKFESKGPAFFIQRRVGKGGREFNMYKIRSMYVNTVACSAESTTEENDPRITPIGRIIRKFRVDELPQFLNVIRGDMALIGPRAEASSSAEELQNEIPLFHYRHIVRPGITGWAQVTQGYASGVEGTREKLAHDFYYVKNLSIWLDLDIVFKTIKTMLTGFGAR